MDVLPFINTALAGTALLLALAALIIAVRGKREAPASPDADNQRKQDAYGEIASILSDGAMLWQRLMIQCDELSAHLISSRLNGATAEAVGDWLATLRDFSKKSKTEIDHAFQMFSQEGKKMSAEELAMQIPDMKRFEHEMKANMTVIADQIDHIDGVLQGAESLSSRQLRITLQKPQAMPHFLRKRQKIAELQRRRSQAPAAA
jgi:hypothetical protein